MPNFLLTTALLLIVVCMIGILVLLRDVISLLKDLFREVGKAQDDSLTRLVLSRLSEAADRQRGTKEAVRFWIQEEGKKTRKDIQEVKTALRDDEKDDQRRKAQSRRVHESSN